MIQNSGNDRTRTFLPGLQFNKENITVIAVHDASFANTDGHKSQRGYWLCIGSGEMKSNHQDLHRMHVLQWHSGKIQRVVRSTLSAEAYSCSEALDAMNFLRGTLCELLDPQMSSREYSSKLHAIPGVCVTDCRSLFDCLHSERTLLSDKRLSLEAAIIRQFLEENVMIKWVSTEQQLADCLTKTLSQRGLQYVQQVLSSNLWTLGPDKRVQVKREQKRADKIQSNEEGKVMNKKHGMKMPTPTAAMFAVTTACCFTTADASEVQIKAKPFLMWFTYFACMVSLILLGILLGQKKKSWRRWQQRWEAISVVIQDIPVTAALPIAWLCGLLAMIGSEGIGATIPTFIWILFGITTPMIWIGVQLYWYQKAMRFHLLEAILRSQKQTIRSVLRDQQNNIQDELDTIRRRIEGLQIYMADGFGDLNAQAATIYEQTARDRHQQNIILNRYFGTQMQYVWGHVDDIDHKLFAIHRRLRNLSHVHEVPSESMDSGELREIMQLRLDRMQQAGSMTESGSSLSDLVHDDEEG